MAFKNFLSDTGLRVEYKEAFTIVSDAHPSIFWTLPTSSMFASMQIITTAVARRAPQLFAFNIVGELWLLTVPVFNLSIGRVCISLFEQVATARDITDQDVRTIIILINALIWFNILTFIIKQCLVSVARKMAGHLRAHFYPLIAAERLSSNQNRSLQRYPMSPELNDSALGNDLISRFIQTLRIYLAAICTFAILTYLVTRTDGPDQWLLFIVIMHFPYTAFKATRAAGSGIFTHDVTFLRLCGLHNLIFSPKYSFNISKDGVRTATLAEYTRSFEQVGPISESNVSLAFRSRFQGVDHIVDILLTCPPFISLVAPLFGVFPVKLSTISFSLYATFIIRPLLNSASFAFINGTFKDILIDGKALISSALPSPPMDASAKLPLVSAIGETSTTSGCVAEPKSECIQPPMTLWKSIPARKMSEATPVRGMRLLYNNVTIEDHSTSPRKVTVGGASFEVQPGYLVLVVGARGSGKTALIEPLIGLSQPASGEIFIDNIPLSSNRMGTYADEMTFHTQHREQVYPLSILENVMWGHGGVRDQALAEELAADVGCQRLLATNGIVGLPFSIYQSFGQGLMGTRTSAAMAQARPMLEEKFSINLTPTEEQRLTAARMLYRLHQGHTRLLVLDEPMHNLTATEESEVICKFLASKGGVTTIIVSKRFKEIAPLADLILCMDNGRIAQHGTHEQLIGKMEGTYANLYNAL